MELSFKVILSNRLDGIAGLGAKDLVPNTQPRFFLSACCRQGGQTGAKAQNDNILCALIVKCFIKLCTTA